jgi:hypothetical protein
MDPFEQAIMAEIQEIVRTGEGGVPSDVAARFRLEQGNPRCRRCGWCCQKAPCLLALATFGKDLKRCPWLSFEEKRASCKFIADRVDRPGAEIARAVVDFEMGCACRR